MIYIGIDTGANTGVAVWDNRTRTLELVDCMKIHQAMKVVEQWNVIATERKTKLIVRVEDARQRTWYEPMARDVERKKLQGVGSVKRDATIWEDFLTDMGVEFEMVAPKQNVTKLQHERFKRITGWQKRTNEHSRDATMLVYGF